MRLDRRAFLGMLGALAVSCRRTSAPADAGPVSRFDGKADDLVLLTDRPPNLEMPARYLATDLTPNEAMFVRWHLSGLPTSVDERTFRLKVAGHVKAPLALSLADLRRLEPVSIVAVNQCSGNTRGAFQPPVPGVQWGRGAVGNAKWTGVRLADLLAAADVRPGAVDVTFGGLDRAPLPSTPDFVKSLPIAHATEPDVLVAWAMNDAPLPMLNGFPLRLVVPGFYSTYWVKALDEITVLDRAFDGYWMSKAYRVPDDADANEQPGALAPRTRPIGRMNVRSLVVRPASGEAIAAGARHEIEGLAWDGGAGIAKVEVSTDGGASWLEAALDRDLGAYAWRRWRLAWTPGGKGPTTITARATSRAGETQRTAPRWNRAGYMKNDPERIEVAVV